MQVDLLLQCQYHRLSCTKCRGGGGGIQICRYVHKHEWRFWNIPQKHVLVMIQKSPPNVTRILWDFASNLTPSWNRFEPWRIWVIFDKATLFFWKWHFRPLNVFPALHVIDWKDPFFTHVYNIVLGWPPGSKGGLCSFINMQYGSRDVFH